MGQLVPRYIVERDFPDGFALAIDRDGAEALTAVVSVNAEEGVTWLQSWVSEDRRKLFDLLEAPGLDRIHAASTRNHLPLGEITAVRVLDPHFYH